MKLPERRGLKMALGVEGYVRQPNIHGWLEHMEVRTLGELTYMDVRELTYRDADS